MSKQVNVHHAKTHLSQLLVDVQQGEEVIIAKAGKPVARLIQVTDRLLVRTPGCARGQVVLSNDFFAPLPKEIVNAFDACGPS